MACDISLAPILIQLSIGRRWLKWRRATISVPSNSEYRRSLTPSWTRSVLIQYENCFSPVSSNLKLAQHRMGEDVVAQKKVRITLQCLIYELQRASCRSRPTCGTSNLLSRGSMTTAKNRNQKAITSGTLWRSSFDNWIRVMPERGFSALSKEESRAVPRHWRM